jgi:hypothetical protein
MKGDRAVGKGYYDRYVKDAPIKLRRKSMEEQNDGFEDDREYDSKKHDISNRTKSEDLRHESNKNFVLLNGFNSKSVQKAISNLPETIMFIAFIDCENADFSNVDLCEYPQLSTVHLKGTPNNLEEQGYDCIADKFGSDIYTFTKN